MCLATPADYRGELPPRCHLHDGHIGAHVSGGGVVAMAQVEPGETWHDPASEPVTDAAVGWWASRARRRAA
jgi:hypothetical protein